MNLVERAKNIILTPKTEWQVIDGEQPDIKQIFTGYVLPLALIPVVASIIGFSLFAHWFSMGVWTAISQIITALVGVYGVAFVVDLLAENFSSEKNIGKSVQLIAYSCTPMWVAGVLYLVPILGVLALLVSLYGLYLLYLGLPVLKKTPQDKVVVYFVVTIVVLIFVFAIVNRVIFGLFGPSIPTMVY